MSKKANLNEVAQKVSRIEKFLGINHKEVKDIHFILTEWQNALRELNTVYRFIEEKNYKDEMKAWFEESKKPKEPEGEPDVSEPVPE